MTDTASIWKVLNKEYQGDAFFRGSDPLVFNWEVIDYPMASLGDASHVWGLPLGKMSQYYGKEGCGKTFLAMIMAAQTQKQYPDSEVLWITAETNFDKRWAAKIGIDLDRIIISPKNDAAQIFNFLCGKVNDKGKLQVPGVLQLAAEGKLNVKLIVIDSIDQLIAPSENTKNFDSSKQFSPLAGFLPFALKRTRPLLEKSKAAMLFINQAREKIVSFGPGGITYAGGRALRHNLDFSIKLHASAGKDGKLMEGDKKVGHKILATVEKCRGGPNGWQAEFWLNFHKGHVKRGEEIAKLGAAYDVVKRPSNTTWAYEDVSMVGKDKFWGYLDENVGVAENIIKEIKERKAKGEDRDSAVLDKDDTEAVGQVQEVMETADELDTKEEK